jgi:glycosyltransferase involved in cell wall biosynthesis
VLHCHLTYGSVFGSIAKIILKNLFGEKHPVIIETNHAVGMPVPKFKRWIHAHLSSFRDGLIFMATDPYWDNFILKHPTIKTAIISNGISVLAPQINDKLKQNFRQENSITLNTKYIVGTVGMLRPDRKPLLYIPIFYEVSEVLGNDVQFILAGSGSEFEKVKMEIAKYNLSKQITVTGFINDPLIAISNMDVYVSLSVGSATGISMIEAAMCGIPVVGIQMTENYEAKNEDWVWSHTNGKEIAKKIIHLLQNTTERNQLSRFQNKYAIENFSSEAMYSSYISFYKKLLPGSRK